MKTQLIILLFSLILNQQNSILIDFGKAKKGRYWNVVNVGVMGGLSCPKNTCPGFLSASTGSTRAVLAMQGAADWGWRLSSTSLRRTTRASPCARPKARALRFRLPS